MKKFIKSVKPLVSLVMIVKDEAASIRGVLEAVKPYVDRWTILDTGSTDGTQDIVQEVMASVPGVSGRLHEEPFIDFATSRNRVMSLDNTWLDGMGDESVSGTCIGKEDDSVAEFQFMLSGDEYLRDGAAFRKHLEYMSSSDRTHIISASRMRIAIDDTTFFSPRIFRTGSPWQYVGTIHEYPTHPDSSAVLGVIPQAFIEHIVSDPEKRFSNIWENHIPILKLQLEANPEDERALIFLAASYESLIPFMQAGERVSYAMEAMSLYLRRLSLPVSSDAEKNYLRMRYLSDARLTGIYSDPEILSRAQELCEADPHRPETALLRLHAATRVLPAMQVYDLAVQAAQVAADAIYIENESPVSTSCGWKAHLVAAKAAEQVMKKHSDIETCMEYAGLVQEHVLQGIKAGGPRELFEGIKSDNMPEVVYDSTASEPETFSNA